MRSFELFLVSNKHKILIAFALTGFFIIMLPTSRYGAGLSPDSVGYISTARNLIMGAGAISYDGAPFVVQPPLYPALLAFVGRILSIDPLLLANVINAFVFGIIVYSGGLLAFKYLPSFSVFAIVAALAILASIPLFTISVMAWSEPLFILFVLLSLLFANLYLEKKDITSLILLSSSVALSSLTRYIGIALILWGALVIIVFYRDSLKIRIAHLSLFLIVSALPLGVWLIRNYAVSNTLFGPRTSSAYTLPQNFIFVFNNLITWYIPGIVADQRPTLILLGVVIGFFAGFNLKESWKSVKVTLRQISPIILFIIIYTAFLVTSSTTTAYDPIGNRLLSPVYVPLTLLFLILTKALVEPYWERFPNLIVNSFLIIGMAIWLVYPIRATILTAIKITQIGQGYSSKAWIESETVRYLFQDQTLESKCAVYTNAPDAAYILADIVSKWSPSKKAYNSPYKLKLTGAWPDESKACLVWFDRIDRQYLYTIDDIKTIANLDLIIQLTDGAIYSVIRK